MHSTDRRLLAAILLAVAFPLGAAAQGTETLQQQAAAAYGRREFLKSAELFLAVANASPDGRAEALYNAGCSLALAGRIDDAFAALDRAVDAGLDDAEQYKADADLTSLRADPRWQPMLDRATASARAFRDFWTSPALQAPYTANLSEDEKIAGLSKLWSEAKFNFIHFDKVPNLDWDALYLGYLPKVRATTSTAEYYRVLTAFYAELKDGHTGVWGPKELADESRARPLVQTALVEDRVLVVRVMDPSAQAAGLTPGLEIVDVDGTPVIEYAKRAVVPYQSASTPQDLAARTYGWSLLEGSVSKPVTLTLRDASGATRQATLARRPSTEYWQSLRADPVVFRMLPGNIAYVALNTFQDNRTAEMFEAAFGEIAKADAIVIDVRSNGGGNSSVGYRVLACLTDKPFFGSKWRTRDYRPAYRAWGRREGVFEGAPDTVPANAKLSYQKPVVVLAGPQTYSAAEDFLVAFHAIGRGQIIGEPSGGSTGQPLMFPLPGGGGARVCTKHDSYADGTEFVGIGVAPDRVVRPTIADVRSGRDAALDAAIAAVSRK